MALRRRQNIGPNSRATNYSRSYVGGDYRVLRREKNGRLLENCDFLLTNSENYLAITRFFTCERNLL